MNLLSHQREGHELIDGFNGRVILADDMGMGKGCTALTWVKKEQDFPCLIVTTASMKEVFLEEIEKHIGTGKVAVIENCKDIRLPLWENCYYIINYDILDAWKEEIFKLKFKCIIFDESHTVANRKTQKNLAMRFVCHGVDHILFLTGTPFMNNEMEMFTMLNILHPTIFPTIKVMKHYIKTKQLRNLLLNTCLIRRLKEDHLDLPDKTMSVIPVEITNFDEYRYAEQAFVSWLQDQDIENQNTKICAFTKLEKLKQLVTDGKTKALEEWLEQRLQAPAKTLVFFTHTKPIEQMEEKFSGICLRLDGRTTKVQRKKIRQKFTDDVEKRFFFLNVKSGGVGLTLIEADAVMMFEMPWTAVACDQCVDRAYRIGQTKEVSALFMIAQNTVEERIAAIIDNKRRQFKATIDGVELSKNQVLMELLYEYKENYYV